MDTSSQMEIDPYNDLSQRSTQPIAMSQEVEDSQPVGAVWGRLLPMRRHLEPLDMTKDSYTFGRYNTDYKFAEKAFAKDFVSISKKQFKIVRQQDGREHRVYLLDESTNGTYVNQKLIKKDRKMLKNNDEIRLLKSSYQVFIYHDCYENDKANFPKELRNKYTIMKEIGRGNYGQVRLAFRHEDSERCAVKILKKKFMDSSGTQCTLSNLGVIQNEVGLLQSVNHNCIVQLYDVVESDDSIYLVMELAEGGELFDRITQTPGQHLPEQTAKLYLYQLCHALRYLHNQGITHRDLKPENILMATKCEDSCVKITDFGLAKLTGDSSLMSTFCGTTTYIAPELLSAAEARKYTRKVDLWSFGVVMFACLAGYPPFSHHSKEANNVAKVIRSGRFTFHHEVWLGVSSRAKDLIRKLLVVDPEQRLDATQALSHPWFQEDSGMKARAAEVMGFTPSDVESDACGTPNRGVKRPADATPETPLSTRKRLQQPTPLC